MTKLLKQTLVKSHTQDLWLLHFFITPLRQTLKLIWLEESFTLMHSFDFSTRAITELRISQRVPRRVRESFHPVLDSAGIYAILRMLNGCSVLAARKSLHSVTNKANESKL